MRVLLNESRACVRVCRLACVPVSGSAEVGPAGLCVQRGLQRNSFVGLRHSRRGKALRWRTARRAVMFARFGGGFAARPRCLTAELEVIEDVRVGGREGRSGKVGAWIFRLKPDLHERFAPFTNFKKLRTGCRLPLLQARRYLQTAATTLPTSAMVVAVVAVVVVVAAPPRCSMRGQHATRRARWSQTGGASST